MLGGLAGVDPSLDRNVRVRGDGEYVIIEDCRT
jgi:hypothetical protein